MDATSLIELPAGFRFCPTDWEIIIHYLLKKVLDKRFVALAIGEADLNKTEPWDLPKMAKTGEKEWYFFWQKYRKYPTGTRTNRATESGYWKATGKDKKIYKGRNSLVGMKKTLVFYKGRAPKGERTNWVSHEYRLEGDSWDCNISRAAKEEWVVCRVFHKNTIIKTSPDVELSTDPFPVPHSDSPKLPQLRDYENPTPCFVTDHDDEFKPIISSSTLMFNNHELQIPSHDQTTFPLPFQSTNIPHIVRPNSDYSIVSHSHDSELSSHVVTDQAMSVYSDRDIESKKPFDEQLDEGLYFDSLWSY